MKKLFFVLGILFLMGALFSCQSTEGVVVNEVEVAEAEEAESEPELEVEEAVEVVEAKPETTVTVDDSVAEPEFELAVVMGPAVEVWQIVGAEVTWEDQVVASAEEIPADFQQLDYLVSVTGDAVSFDVSGHNVATGSAELSETGEIAVRVEFLDWESLALVEGYFGVYVEDGLMPAYYFHVQKFTGDSATLSAEAYGYTLSLQAIAL